MMTTSIYRITSPKFTGGAIYLCYRNGLISAFDAADVVLSPEQAAYLMDKFPVHEANALATEYGFPTFTDLVVPKTAKEKIIVFCQYYKSYRGVTYVPTQQERSNIRTVPVTADLLRIWFTDSTLSNFTIVNYISRINITKDRLKNGMPGERPQHPNFYDKKYEAGLQGNAIMDYHMHLTKLGWRKAHGPAGTVWNPPRKQESVTME